MFESHYCTIFHCTSSLTNNKSQNHRIVFLCDLYAVSLVTMVIHSRAKHLYLTFSAVVWRPNDWLSNVLLGSPLTLCIKSVNSVWARDLLPQQRIQMGKNYQKLIGKRKKYKSIFIFGSVFISGSQRHIQQDLHGILRTWEGEDKRGWALNIHTSIHWMPFLGFYNKYISLYK